MARSSECTDSYAQKVLDAADIVREAIFQQLPNGLNLRQKNSPPSTIQLQRTG
jgi:hypothetical protein